MTVGQATMTRIPMFEKSEMCDKTAGTVPMPPHSRQEKHDVVRLPTARRSVPATFVATLL